MPTRWLPLLCVALFAGCANPPGLVVGSEDEWPETYAAQGLREYRRGDLQLLEHRSLGWVDAAACGPDSRGVPPSPRELTRRLKREAADRGANGIVDLSCRSESDHDCGTRLSCAAEAVEVQQ